MSGIDDIDVLAGNDEFGDLQRIAELEAEAAQLHRAMASRQQVGFVSGMLAERYGLNQDEAWALLVRLSQRNNTKLREVARIIYDGAFGDLTEEDRELATRLNADRPSGGRPLVDLRRHAGGTR